MRDDRNQPATHHGNALRIYLCKKADARSKRFIACGAQFPLRVHHSHVPNPLASVRNTVGKATISITTGIEQPIKGSERHDQHAVNQHQKSIKTVCKAVCAEYRYRIRAGRMVRGGWGSSCPRSLKNGCPPRKRMGHGCFTQGSRPYPRHRRPVRHELVELGLVPWRRECCYEASKLVCSSSRRGKRYRPYRRKCGRFRERRLTTPPAARFAARHRF